MPQPAAQQFSGIFVSYRRDDSAGHAGRLSDKLSDHFGKDQIFMDIDNIQPGEDFVQVIENAVGSCEILIAVIGRNWLTGTGRNTGPLSNPNDYVRLEIATALKRDVRVIPVLVQRATMPKLEDLPDDLTKLSRRNALELTDTGWQRDVDQLIYAIEKIRDRIGVVPRPEPKPGLQPEPVPGPARSHRTLLVVAATLIVATVIAVILFIRRSAPPVEPPGSANANATPATNQTKETPAPPAGMVYVPTEEFMMGRDDGNVNERPAHLVPVAGFFIDQHEVTCDEYAELIQTGHPAPPNWINGKVPNGEGRKPVTNVKWDDANAYCNKYGKHLPKEEEWELAARGTKGYLYPWGDHWRTGLANVQTRNLAEVGHFQGLSPYGAVDMVGNAWEWTASPLTPYPNGVLSEQSAGNCAVAADCKVMRGGSYVDSPSEATTTYRAGYPARTSSDYSKIG